MALADFPIPRKELILFRTSSSLARALFSLKILLRFCDALVEQFHVGKYELGIYGVDIGKRINMTRNVNNIIVVEALGFLTLILLGYTAGIAKVYLVDGFQGFLLIPYAINFILVGTETALYFRNIRLDRQSERESGTRDRDGA